MHHPWQPQAPCQEIHILETTCNNGFFLPNPEERVVVWLLCYMVITLKVLRPLTENVDKPIRATIFCGFLQCHPIYLQLKKKCSNVFIFADTESIIKHFSATPYIGLLHSTVDAVSLFLNFLWHFLHNAFFENYYTWTLIEP